MTAIIIYEWVYWPGAHLGDITHIATATSRRRAYVLATAGDRALISYRA